MRYSRSKWSILRAFSSVLFLSFVYVSDFSQVSAAEDRSPVPQIVGRWQHEAENVLTARFTVRLYRFSNPSSQISRDEIIARVSQLEPAAYESFFKELLGLLPPLPANAGRIWDIEVNVSQQGTKKRNHYSYTRPNGKVALKHTEVFDGQDCAVYDEGNSQLSLGGDHSGQDFTLCNDLRFIPNVHLRKNADKWRLISNSAHRVRMQSGPYEIDTDADTGFVFRMIDNSLGPRLVKEVIQFRPRLVSNDFYFPSLGLTLSVENGKITSMLANVIVKAECNIDVPDDEFNALDVPVGTKLVDLRQGRSAATVSKLEKPAFRISEVREIADTQSRTREVAAQQPNENRAWLKYILIVGLLTGFGMVIWGRSFVRSRFTQQPTAQAKAGRKAVSRHQ